MISEVDPICAYQAAMDGYQVVTMEQAASLAGCFCHRHRLLQSDSPRAYAARMKDYALLCNIGHFDCEIELGWLEQASVEKIPIKPQVDRYYFKDSQKSLIILAEGRLVNLGCAHGHPSFVMSNSFSNQVLAQIELWNKFYEIGIYRLPKLLDEKVARLHLKKLAWN